MIPTTPQFPPRPNLNGSSPEDTLEGWLTVRRAACDLATALSKVFPHGRDFQTYVEPGEAARMVVGARDEHVEVITAARDISDYAYEMAILWAKAKK